MRVGLPRRLHRNRLTGRVGQMTGAGGLCVMGPTTEPGWRRKALRCDGCPHDARLDAGRCSPTQACVRDPCASRNDRFFVQNPDLAGDYLDHTSSAVRAAAARHACPFQLLPLIEDPEPAVRREVARRIADEWLSVMAWDDDPLVRRAVAERLEPEQLTALVGDGDARVRIAVARRVDPEALPALAEDPAEMVRAVAQRRLDAFIAGALAAGGPA